MGTTHFVHLLSRTQFVIPTEAEKSLTLNSKNIECQGRTVNPPS